MHRLVPTLIIYVRQGKCLLGDIVGAEIRLKDLGSIAREYRLDVPLHFSNVSVGSSVIMPNQLHSIIVIQEGGGETPPLQHLIGKPWGSVSAPATDGWVGASSRRCPACPREHHRRAADPAAVPGQRPRKAPSDPRRESRWSGQRAGAACADGDSAPGRTRFDRTRGRWYN